MTAPGEGRVIARLKEALASAEREIDLHMGNVTHWMESASQERTARLAAEAALAQVREMASNALTCLRSGGREHEAHAALVAALAPPELRG